VAASSRPAAAIQVFMSIPSLGSEQKKQFFFEKKNQKTFAYERYRPLLLERRQAQHSFLF
jgi:hypothetical protein